MKHADALRIAEGLLEKFRPVCMRIEIKGSVCRGKEEPKDIELLAIPDLSPVPRGKLEFGKPILKVYKTRLDAMVEEMEQAGVCIIRSGGEKYKKLWMIRENVQVDLFLVTPPAQWGVQSVIRTGPSDFSHWMVTRKSRGGALPDEYIMADGAVGKRVRTSKGESREGVIPMPEEADFFRLCGMKWVEPRERFARWKVR